MEQEEYKNILHILNQIWWPVKITYQIKQITLISEELIRYHINKIEFVFKTNKAFYEEYSISDMYSLYACLNFVINDLWVDEFETIIWEDFFNSWLKLLSWIKEDLLNYNK